MRANDHLNRAVEEAEKAFWAKIVDVYPHVRSGDLPPEAHNGFLLSCREIVEIWLEANEAPEVLTDLLAQAVAATGREVKIADGVLSFNYNGKPVNIKIE